MIQELCCTLKEFLKELCYTYKIKMYMYRNNNIIVEICCFIALQHFFRRFQNTEVMAIALKP